MRYTYNFFLYLILPFLPLRLLWRSRKNIAYRQRMFERFGYFNFPPTKECIWVHAVSLGEAISAVPLIRALIRRYPNTAIVVTTMTPTGAERIQKIFNKEVIQLYVPYDYPFIVKRFLRQFNPKILVLMETELWPNILYYSAKRKVPIILCNARLSAKSVSGYKKIRGFMKQILDYITMVVAQSKIDGERFLALGLDPQKLLIGGNIKFDITIPDEVLLQATQLRLVFGKTRPIWIAASTHNMEEEKILIAAKKVLEILPDALLILVPRHLERFDKIFELCRNDGFNVVRYSNKQDYAASTNVVLGDVMGQLLLFYAVSDIAFVGGSLVPWGGHNLLEPAALAKPVISGPNLNAFLEISQLLIDGGALVKVDDEIILAQNLLKLFQDQNLREKLGAAALDVVEKHRGTTGKIMALIETLCASLKY